MTYPEAVAEATKYNIDNYRNKGVKFHGMTFFPVKIAARPHPDPKGKNHEVFVELELLSSDNIHMPLKEYLAMLKA
jgi:hypothetical protein